jgi:hypothetical protein
MSLFFSAAFLSLSIAAGALVSPSAYAAPQEGAYIVSDVKVDASGSSGPEAQSRAFASARVQATRQLLARLTLAEDRTSAGFPPIDAALADRLTAAIDVQEERRSAGRYLGTLRVVFDPSAVRRLLRDAQVPFTDSVAPLAILAPVTGTNAAELASPWRSAWGTRGEGLAPYTIGRGTFSEESGWADVSRQASEIGARRMVLASLKKRGSQHVVNLIEIFADGGRASMGETSGAGSVSGAFEQARDLIENSWKAAAIVRGGARSQLTATARFANQLEWNGLRAALTRAASISDIRVDAVAADGAIVTFQFVGATERLEVDLRRQGVLVENTLNGLQLRPAGVAP